MNELPQWFGILIFLVIVHAVIGFQIWWRVSAKNRRAKRMRPLAERLGMQYVPQDDSVLRLPIFATLARGRDRHAEHVLRGTHKGMKVSVFDVDRIAEENRRNEVIQNSVILFQLERQFPFIRVIHDRITPVIYLQEAPPHTEHVPDIFPNKLQFDEPRKFSRKFIVVSDNEAAARALLTPAVREFLLREATKTESLGMIEFGGNAVMWRTVHRERPQILEDRLRFMHELVEMLPELRVSEQAGGGEQEQR